MAVEPAQCLIVCPSTRLHHRRDWHEIYLTSPFVKRNEWWAWLANIWSAAATRGHKLISLCAFLRAGRDAARRLFILPFKGASGGAPNINYWKDHSAWRRPTDRLVCCGGKMHTGTGVSRVLQQLPSITPRSLSLWPRERARACEHDKRKHHYIFYVLLNLMSHSTPKSC